MAIYKKAMNPDGDLETLNDKRAACILLQNSLTSLFDQIWSKILTVKNLDQLEHILEFMLNINYLLRHFIMQNTKSEMTQYDTCTTYYPLLLKARQMSIHTIVCSMLSMLHYLKTQKYFTYCYKIFVLNNFIRTLTPSKIFLEKYIVRHPHFHL